MAMYIYESGSFITWVQVSGVLSFPIIFSYLPLKTEYHIIKSILLVS